MMKERGITKNRHKLGYLLHMVMVVDRSSASGFKSSSQRESGKERREGAKWVFFFCTLRISPHVHVPCAVHVVVRCSHVPLHRRVAASLRCRSIRP